MKLATENLPPSLTSGNLAPVNMGISDNAEDQLMILNVLSNTLYTDKVSAVLREYGCNAFDANVEAGKGHQPIEVTLPNKLEPTVRIRDFGFGMTQQQIADVFCKLGRSTKRNSNAFTGMLGIGSKAGFAYGDSFMVTSWADGKKVVYNAFRDRGVPRLAQMLETKSDAPDGIEVKVPVRVADIPEFITKAERVYRYFKVRPIIHGAKIDFTKSEAKFKGAGWRYTGTGHSFAIMGNVGYDLTLAGMGLSQYSGGTTASMIELGIELDFDIGDLEIAANREGLQYRDQTKKAITDRLKVAATEIGKGFTVQIGQAKTLWEAHQMYAEAFEKTGSSDVRKLRDLVSGQIVWQGQKISGGRFEIENKEKNPDVSIWMAEKMSYYRRIQKTPNPHHCNTNEHTTLVINDLPSKKNSPSRVKGHFEAHPDAQQLVIFTFQNAKAQAAYWKARQLDGAPTVLLSSLPQSLATKNANNGGPSAHRSKHSAKCFVLDEKTARSSYGTGARSAWWENTEVDMKTDTGVYVVLETFYVRAPGSPINSNEHPEIFRQKVLSMRAAGLITMPVHGFKADKVAKLDSSRWTKLADHVQANLDAAVAKGNAPQEIADYIKLVNHQELFNEKNFAKLRLPSGTPLHTLFTEMDRMRNPKSLKALRELINDGGAAPWLKKPSIPKPSIDLAKLERDVLDTYPMIELMEKANGRLTMRCFTEKQMNVVADYVRLVEA